MAETFLGAYRADRLGFGIEWVAQSYRFCEADEFIEKFIGNLFMQQQP